MAKSEKFSKSEPAKTDPAKSDKTDPAVAESEKTEKATEPEPDKTTTEEEGELGGEYADGEAPDYGFTSGQHDDSAATITLPEADPAQDDDAGFEFGSGEEPEPDTAAGEPVDNDYGDPYIEDSFGNNGGNTNEEDPYNTQVDVTDDIIDIEDDNAEEDVVTDEFAEEDVADEAWFPELADATVSGFDTSHLQSIDGSSESLSDSIVDDVIFEG